MKTATFIALPVVLTAALSTTSASAANWGEKVEKCMTAIHAEGLADTSKYEAQFEKGSERRFSIELFPVQDGEILYARCRMARGEITSVELRS